MKVKIYGTEKCPNCHKARDFFNKNEIEVEYIDVGTNKEERDKIVEKTQQRRVPIIEMGNEIIIEFDEAKIRKKIRRGPLA